MLTPADLVTAGVAFVWLFVVDAMIESAAPFLAHEAARKRFLWRLAAITAAAVIIVRAAHIFVR